MQIKGTAIAPVARFIKKKFGEENFNHWLDSLESEAKEIYSKDVLVSEWYDFIKIYHLPMVKICEIFYPGQENQGARELGRYSAEYALRGIYSLFIKIGTPQFVIKKASAILPTYYRPSKLEVKQLSDTHLLLLITEAEGITALAEERIAGYIEKASEISGGKNTKLAITKSLAAGNAFTEYDITWET